MRILLINKFYGPRGGTERVLFDLEAGFRARGHEVAIFAMKTPDMLETPWQRFFVEAKDYDRVGVLRKIQHARSTFYDAEARDKLEALLREFSPDVAHLHNIYHQLSPSILKPLQAQGIPVVMTLHDYKLACPAYQLFRQGQTCEKCVATSWPLWPALHRCQRDSWSESVVVALESTLHRRLRSYEGGVDAFVSPSRFLRDVMERRGIAPEQLRVIPNAAREQGQPAAAERRDEKPRVLFAGRLSREKGVDTLLAAAAQVPHVQLAVAGDGPLREELAALAAPHAQIELLGKLDATALAEQRARCWAVAVPSVWYENAPLTVLEAYASGRPVLASAHGGLLEMVQADRTGTLLPPGDVAAWAGALDQLSARRDELAVQGQRGREWLERDFDYESWLDRHEQLYASLADR